MNELPGNDSTPPGCLPSDLDGPASQPADEAKAEADWWNAWWSQWSARRLAEDAKVLEDKP